ncbi:hypothetical protein WJ96_07540 [Burkholderia ubonensis]|uniref:Recombinase NinB n=1 Tax=Burkholderia ubonensis TaxID=101571 RepID=A0AAW3MU94_9BURK|nr:recombination protein NinB [Burkholderia ubonensis]KVP75550.1 hypothetical protein WJ93_09330 [Burkholderia ubonensis]KVP97014.1 hypothetical protein WJ97_14440 [Burkholderia ubonensis]KVP98364.1 hypothetical protein WJ96_07540 [Burkholderia ubonensis]KVZ93062.1 hypothetical protein WL25_19200 [Burkholderia ubonensis]
MTVALYGSLSDPQIRAQIDKAQLQPEKWAIYLVQGNSNQRSLAQNRLYRTVLRKLAQQQGRSVQYWNDFLVERFLGFDEVVTEDGYLRKVLPSTSELTVAEFTEFLNACLTFASENQVH